LHSATGCDPGPVALRRCSTAHYFESAASPQNLRCAILSGFSRGQLFLEIDDLLYLREKPAVDLGQVEDLLDGEAGSESVADKEDPLRIRHAQLAADHIPGKHITVTVDLRPDTPRLAVAAQAAAP